MLRYAAACAMVAALAHADTAPGPDPIHLTGPFNGSKYAAGPDPIHLTGPDNGPKYATGPDPINLTGPVNEPKYGSRLPITRPYKDDAPKPYAFEYGVADDYAGATFSQHEASDANTVTGSYSVLLPDGRTQTVTYTADPYGNGGFNADVKYDGHAEPYHPPKHAHRPPPAAPYHKPEPVRVYQPSPAPVLHHTKVTKKAISLTNFQISSPK